jgi:hypothetical protein
MREKKESSSFSEEKEPKRLLDSVPQRAHHPGSKVIKVFCAAFLQKSGCLLTS